METVTSWTISRPVLKWELWGIVQGSLFLDSYNWKAEDKRGLSVLSFIFGFGFHAWEARVHSCAWAEEDSPALSLTYTTLAGVESCHRTPVTGDSELLFPPRGNAEDMVSKGGKKQKQKHSWNLPYFPFLPSLPFPLPRLGFKFKCGFLCRIL